jgi:hypothetical protein
VGNRAVAHETVFRETGVGASTRRCTPWVLRRKALPLLKDDEREVACAPFDRVLGLGSVVGQRLDTELRAQLLGLSSANGWAEVEVREVRSVVLAMDPAPGLTRCSPQEIGLAIPLQGAWRLEVEAVVRARVKLPFTWVTVTLPPVRLVVDDLRVDVRAAFDTSDPLRPVLQRVDRPRLDFRVRLRSSNWLFGLLLQLLSPVADGAAQRAVTSALDALTPQLSGMGALLPGPIPGDGAPLLTDSGRAVPLGEIARNVDRKIRRDHLPHGTLLMTVMDVPSTDSWEIAYRNGGPGNPGTPTWTTDGEDSAIFSGMYLASQAFRYAATGESEAFDSLAWVLQGLGRLFAVNGDSGLLARVAAPEASVMGQNVHASGVDGRATLQGQPWVGWQGKHGISRDQYIGVLFGLIVTHDLVPDPAVRGECSRLFQLALDYLISRDWIVDEDRVPFDGYRNLPTFYFGVVGQRLLYLHMGLRLDPAKYAAEFARWTPLVELAWTGAWVGVMNLDSYYKFNLTHLANYGYFRVETDPVRWQEMARTHRFMRRYTEHHKNPHFNLIQADVEPSLAATHQPAAQEALRQFVTRNHRRVAPPVVDLSGVTWVTITVPKLVLNGGSGSGPSTVTLPSEPLDVHLRRPMADFMWQREPFTPASPNQGDPRVEKNGLDLVLPYWMGHHHGAW